MTFEKLSNYCGSPFWDSNLTWNSADPEFTICFEKTVLVWIPVFTLWLFLPVDLYLSYKYKKGNIRWNWFNLSKLVICCMLSFIEAFEIIYNIITLPVYAPVYSFSPAILMISFVLCAVLTIYHKFKGQRASGLLFIFWAVIVITNIPIFKRDIYTFTKGNPSGTNFSHVFSFTLMVSILFLNFFADRAPEGTIKIRKLKESPEDSSSFPSRLTFSWYDSLAFKGYRKNLLFSDLWCLSVKDSCCYVSSLFNKYWMKAYREARANHSNKDPSISGALWKAFKGAFLFGSLMKLVQVLLVFTSPLILRLLMQFVERDGHAWKGYFYAILLFVIASLQTLLLSQFYNSMYLVGLHVRTTLMSAIYKKMLRLSNNSRMEYSTGEIINLVAVDSQRLMDLVIYLNVIWSAPLETIVTFYFLWSFLGSSVIIGIVLMPLLIPLNWYVANKIKKVQVKQMLCKDERIKLMSEVLTNIKVLKFNVWESHFENEIKKFRNREGDVLKKIAYYIGSSSVIWACAPYFISLVIFIIYTLSDPRNILNAETAFVAISFVNILRTPLTMVPQLITTSAQAAVSLKRINNFLNCEELDRKTVQHYKESETMVSPDDNKRQSSDGKSPLILKNLAQDMAEVLTGLSNNSNESEYQLFIERGNFRWNKSEEATLKGINLKVKPGNLVIIVGGVGSGKSSLLLALLGEMERLSGRVNTRGKIAYASQEAWIQNASVKDNILFKKGMVPEKYQRVVFGCALIEDIVMLPAGDQTEIGEKGVNISGGQKQRISLARAVYQDADVYLLDDPLSAVDAHVGKHIFENIIGPSGLLKNKTRVLVTNSVNYLSMANQIVVVKNGFILETGSMKELMSGKSYLRDYLITNFNDLMDDEFKEFQEVADDNESRVMHREEEFQDVAEEIDEDKLHFFKSLRERFYSVSAESFHSCNETDEKSNSKIGKCKGELTEEESTEIGKVKWDVYLTYLNCVGLTWCLVSFIFNSTYEGITLGSSFWLSDWSSDPRMIENGKENKNLLYMYLGIYGLFGFLLGVSAFLADVTPMLGCTLAAISLHKNILVRVLKAPMSFFDITPVGRLLSRFSKDIDILDNVLPRGVCHILWCSLELLGMLIVIIYSTPYFIIAMIPISFIYYFIQRFYTATSTQLMRLESVSRSPIFSHFSETISGAVTVRAYKMEETFIKEYQEKVDINQMCLYPSLIANRWLGVRLEMLGNLIILFAAVFAVLERNIISSALVGLSITYALQITQTLNGVVKAAAEVETNIVSAERIKEYCEIPQEKTGENPTISHSWPAEGMIEFKNFSTRYRTGLDYVLKNVNLTIWPRERIGVVGRTGAGKSSLALSLFRIIEASEGKIFIDGIDISLVTMEALRSSITIIPQDPVMFSGSLRMNLDPFINFSDEEIWKALELSYLKTVVKSFAAGLFHEIFEGGSNFSVGQRQLVCLARALLYRTKILILDEATAAVDLETDRLIQATIKKEFVDCTVITIAHRINTVLDSDKILVLEKGCIAEFDTPDVLLSKKSTIFYSLFHESREQINE